MATLYISEFNYIANTHLPMVGGRSLVDQAVTIGMSSTSSAAFGPLTQVIEVACDAACSIQIGASPVASASARRLAANERIYYAVLPGDKIAVITNS